jgi:uncharacterized glyoxalase superfamily protein PhnB
MTASKISEAAMADAQHAIEIQTGLGYRDPRKAMEWLAAAFGFTPTLIVTDASGRISVIMMQFGGCTVALGHQDEAVPRGAPRTASIHVRGRTPDAIDINAHCERARAAGAKIVQEPAQAFWGDFDYAAEDLEGYVWRFGQHVEGAGGPPPEGWTVELDRE